VSAERNKPARKTAAKSPAKKKRAAASGGAKGRSLFPEEKEQAQPEPAQLDTSQGNVVYTVGHSTLPIEDFIARLRGHGVTLLVDVRKMPGSRRHPQFGRDALAHELSKAGIRYVHAPELGGFRKARPDSVNTGWRNASFQGYADYMQTPEFDAAVQPIIARAEEEKQALMCAESVPWRCHRSLLADALTVRGLRVEEIQSPKKTSEHALTPFARVAGMQLIYPPEE
jgi:uncharacterized protein (DUF488 family)